MCFTISHTSFSIKAHDTLYLRKIKRANNDSDEDFSLVATGEHEVEVGFKNSVFTSTIEISSSSDLSQGSENGAKNNTSWICSDCTFLNEPAHLSCEICNGDRKM